MSTRPGFLLSKWYMDCVSDTGEVFIGYAATVRRRNVALHYSSVLLHSGGTTRTRMSLRPGTAPLVEPSAVHWTSRALGVRGTWQALDPPVEYTLAASDAGALRWHCIQPRARATLAVGNTHRLDGYGYVEHLTVSLSPRHLPIDELRWGRWLSAEDGMVWIDWRGAQPLRIVLHNGRPVDAPVVTDHSVTYGTGTPVLALDDRHVLRKGRLTTTALSAVPGLRRLFPARLLGTYECKWRSRGVLHAEGAAERHGWAIHELVCFGSSYYSGEPDETL